METSNTKDTQVTSSTITPRTFVGEHFTIVTGDTPETAHAGYVNDGRKIQGLVAEPNGEMSYDVGENLFIGPVGSEYNKFMKDEGLAEDPRVPGADGSPAKEPPKPIAIPSSTTAAADPAPATTTPTPIPLTTASDASAAHASKLLELVGEVKKDASLVGHWFVEAVESIAHHLKAL